MKEEQRKAMYNFRDGVRGVLSNFGKRKEERETAMLMNHDFEEKTIEELIEIYENSRNSDNAIDDIFKTHLAAEAYLNKKGWMYDSYIQSFRPIREE